MEATMHGELQNLAVPDRVPVAAFFAAFHATIPNIFCILAMLRAALA